MIPFHKISFIGLGLIGGSVAKAINKKYPDIEIMALASHESTLKEAYDDGVIKNCSIPSLDEISSSDLIILAGPVRVNLDYLDQLSGKIKDNTIITDVGSVKSDIHKKARSLGLAGSFIGGHPMAGTEKTGYGNSSPYLIENAYYILTTDPEMDKTKVSVFSDFIKDLGAIPLSLTPEKHDFAVAAISHLPHIISASLVNLVSDQDDKSGLLKTIAAGGFRDITRISSSSPIMWQNICLENKDEILHLIDLYQEELKNFKDAVRNEDGHGLIESFSRARDYRDSLPVRDSGALIPSFEFYVDQPDEVGAIASVSTLLASEEISIRNIGIIHNREFEDGVLGIEFYDEKSMEKAEKLMCEKGYTIHKKQ